MKLISWNVNGIRACIKEGFSDFFVVFEDLIDEIKLSEIHSEVLSSDHCSMEVVL